MLKTALVIPCYNESRRLKEAAFTAALAQYAGLELVFVNDGSSDSTGELLTQLRAHNAGRVSVIEMPRNMGKAEAVRRGLSAALKRDFTLLGYWDADLAAPLSELAKLQQALAQPGVQVALGARVHMLGTRIKRRLLRHYLGRAFATGASLALALPVYDTQCGAKLFRRTPMLEAALAEAFTTRWVFDVELLARLELALQQAHGPGLLQCAVECPLSEWTDVGGSSVTLRAMLRSAVDLWRVACRYGWRLRGRH